MVEERTYKKILLCACEPKFTGIEKGMVMMVTNALETTKSIKQTAAILRLKEEDVRKIAKDKEVHIND